MNFYHHNQWAYGGSPLAHNNPLARPLHELLAEGLRALHPGWDNERYCPNGLLSLADDPAGRTAHDGLAAVIAEFGAARRAAGELAGAVAGQDQSCRQSPN